ncbi:MAG: 16S rRNA processing protein RimM [Gemmatimonadales bacterium]|nr:16S rRNA processing protein RimM [Gemmatimonadales bacterium]
MDEGEARHLVVGRLRKPHGLKGDCAVFPLTDTPAQAFALGHRLWIRNLAGEVVAGPLEIERTRPYHREWLVAFRGHLHVDAVGPWRGHFLEAEAGTLRPPSEGEVYLHELEGFAVQAKDGIALGLVTRAVEAPSGLMLEVQGPKREFLMPFRKEFVVTVDRAGRRLVVDLPEGLAEL